MTRYCVWQPGTVIVQGKARENRNVGSNMLMLYEYTGTDQTVHDNVSEYCRNEKMDEEYLRALLYKSGRPVLDLLSLFSFLRNKRTQKCMANY